jgi:putative endonuclease
MKGWMYILKCCDETLYTGSTNNLNKRLQLHSKGQAANYTKKRLPVELLYCEEFERVDLAFQREKQVQGWSKSKKEALIAGDAELLHELAICQNDSHFQKKQKEE